MENLLIRRREDILTWRVAGHFEARAETILIKSCHESQTRTVQAKAMHGSKSALVTAQEASLRFGRILMIINARVLQDNAYERPRRRRNFDD